MSSESTEESLCDGHHELPETAAVICFVHQDFLCVQCLIGGEKKPECDVKQLDKLSPSENRLFEVLKVRKRLAERKDLIQSYTKTVSEKIDELKTQVKDHAEELVQKVRENEGITLKDIETQEKTLLDNDGAQLKQIQELESEISEKAKRFAKDADNITQKEVSNLYEMLGNVAVMNDKIVLGSYIKKMTLTGDSNGLGTAQIHENLVYDEVQDNALERKDENREEQSSPIAVRHDVISTCQSKAPPPPPRDNPEQRSASTEAVDSSKENDTAENAKAGPGPNDGEDKTKKSRSFLGKSKEGSKKQGDASRGKGSSKTQETPNKKVDFFQFPGLCGLTSQQLHVYESSPKQKQSKASITNILVRDQNALVLFDEIKHRLIVANFSGEIAITHELSKDPIKITAIEENSFAILNCKDLSMKTFRIENEELKVSDVKMSFCDSKPFHVLGFEYGKIKKQFALSWIEEDEGMLRLINSKTGEVADVSRTFPVQSTGRKCNPDHFKTLYDFVKDGVYILKTSSKTMKCYSFVKKDFDWKIKCKDANFVPDQVVFDEHYLYITSKKNFTLFSKESGETKTTQTAHVGKLKAICLMMDQRLAIVSCDSSDSRKSMTLEFIAL